MRASRQRQSAPVPPAKAFGIFGQEVVRNAGLKEMADGRFATVEAVARRRRFSAPSRRR